MKRRNLILSIALLITALAAFTACKKRGDYEVPCKIEKITEKYRFNDTDPYEITTATFSYTPWGDPKSIIMSRTSTGKPNYYFYYDNQHRLISRKDMYDDNVTIDLLTRYKYDSNNFIVSDTSWYSGQDGDDVSTFYAYFVDYYWYDSKGRISKIVTTYSTGIQPYTREYAYDAQGNMIRPGNTYDNKTNYLRTSLILAFTMRDYSMNNYIPALSYNTKKLPTSYSTDWKNVASPRFFNMMVNEIEYTCDSHHND
jgi:hypothetical protein